VWIPSFFSADCIATRSSLLVAFHVISGRAFIPGKTLAPAKDVGRAMTMQISTPKVMTDLTSFAMRLRYIAWRMQHTPDAHHAFA